jgi:hypothetical protein
MLILVKGRTVSVRERIEEYAKPRASFVSLLAENYSGTEQRSLAWVMTNKSVNPL